MYRMEKWTCWAAALSLTLAVGATGCDTDSSSDGDWESQTLAVDPGSNGPEAMIAVGDVTLLPESDHGLRSVGEPIVGGDYLLTPAEVFLEATHSETQLAKGLYAHDGRDLIVSAVRDNNTRDVAANYEMTISTSTLGPSFDLEQALVGGGYYSQNIKFSERSPDGEYRKGWDDDTYTDPSPKAAGIGIKCKVRLVTCPETNWWNSCWPLSSPCTCVEFYDCEVSFGLSLK